MTIKDIAKLCGVSPSTVSKVMNNKADNISEQTKNRVLAIVNENGYATYQKLRETLLPENKLLGLLVPDVTNVFFGKYADAVENYAFEKGYSLIICNTNNDSNKELKYYKALLSKRVDGFIIATNTKENNSYIQSLSEQGTKIVMLQRDFESSKISQVYINNITAGFLGAERLIKAGHTKIGLISGFMKDKIYKDRTLGFKMAFKQQNIIFNEEFIYEGDGTALSGKRGARFLFDMGVTAIFSQNDLMSFGVYEFLSQNNLAVGTDISIVGFDDLSFNFVPQLTTVSSPIYDMAIATTKTLIDMIENKKYEQNICFEPKIIEKESVQKPKKICEVSMEKIIVVGSLNMDIIIKVPHIPGIGETILSEGVKTAPGGKGANQAVTIGKLGGDVHMIGRVGRDAYGRKLFKNLTDNFVKAEGILLDDDQMTGQAYIYVSNEGDNNIVVNSGANNMLDITQIKSFEKLFDDVKYCIVQFEIPQRTVEFLIEFCKEKNIRLIINPAPARKIDFEKFKDVYMIIPNETELDLLIETNDTIEEKAKKLSELGFKRVLVTLGEKGCLYIDEKKNLEYFNAVEGFTAVDTTGAGDSFIGALTTFLAEGKTIRESIQKASLVAAITVSRPGAQPSIPNRETVGLYTV